MQRKSFTLVEIMIVVAIIGLLAAIAIPSFVKARNVSRTNACINNLRLIDAGKEQWALENNLNTGDACTDGEAGVIAYLKGSVAPVCPAGGIYTYGAIGTAPDCDVQDHDLP